MKDRLARGIVRFRVPLLLGMIVLTLWGAASISRTRINYDLNRYLDENTMTRRALDVMEAEFGTSEQLYLVFQDQGEDALAEMISRLNDLPEVLLASRSPETDDIQSDGTQYQRVTLTMNAFDPAELIPALREMFPEAGEYWVGGSAATSLDVQQSVGAEMPLVMGISVAVVLAVLLMTSHAWLEPLVLLLVLGMAIVINLGTNFIFPDVSFITFAVSAILQLALSIDYAIMLIHAWNDFQDEGLEAASAMEKALSQCFLRIASSAMTTVAGLLSLLFMSFTIGFDIGLALSKGIVISMLGVFLITPGLALMLQKPLRKTRHRPLPLHGERLGDLVYRLRKPLAALLLAAILAGLWLQGGNTYTFNASASSTKKTESRLISELYGESTPLVLMVPAGETDEDYDSQRQLVHHLQEITSNGEPALGNISAMVTTGEAAISYYSVQDVAEMTHLPQLMISLFFRTQGFGETVRGDRLIEAAGALSGDNETVAGLAAMLETARAAFKGPHYDRMLIEVNLSVMDPALLPVVDQVLAEARAVYGDDFYVTGVPMSVYDIGNAFRNDLMKVNLITFLAIFLIVALSFRSLSIPVLLVFVIEGAIWITMGCSRLMGQSVFFISYLICVSIQMGATIDYAILLTDQYRENRREGRDVKAAISEAMRKALPTVLTSGVILVTAGYIIGRQCSIFYIADIGALLARGAAISVALVLLLLPALLCLTDRVILRKKRL